ncbi:MAG TPA: Calx-beta domain-containing protein, partial [Woeseiaceae bacterium]|nr:Calx-beta domain-containing protein [Woeseiaceae bacterium]
QGDDVGTSVSTGDIDADGIQDLIIGSPRADLEAPISGSPGATYVVFGRTAADGGFPPRTVLPLLAEGDGSDGFVLTGTDRSDSSGAAVGAGDINGDGVDDIIVGADLATATTADEGRTYVVYGRRASVGGFPSLIPLSSLPDGDGSTGFVLNGEERGDRSGNRVTAADINGDGIEDVIVGAALANPGGTNRGRNDAGKTYVVYGRNDFPAEFELSSLAAGDGSTGFVLYGAARNDAVNRNDYFGIALSGGDLNGDGIADLAIGATGADPGGREEAGAAYVVFGRAAGSPTGPVLRIDGNASAVEGDYLQFKVTLSRPADENVSYQVRTIDGTATSPGDYGDKGGARLMAPGETEQIIWVPTVNDAAIEENETLRLRLSNPENAELGKASARGTIVDNDDTSDWARLTVANARAAEGELARFELTLSKPTKQDVKFAVQTVDVTATANQDYAPKGGTRIIPAGEISATIFVEIAEDNLAEGVEKFRLRVEARSNNAVVVRGNATGTITVP